MKCLFVASKLPDYLASCLWDGLQEILGEENVVDANGCPWLHKSLAGALCQDLPGIGYLGGREVLRSIGASREGRMLSAEEDGFDLLIINASFNRDTDWNFIDCLTSYRLRRCGRIAYVEGWDSARHEIFPPQRSVHAVFRKEIEPGFQYPYECRHLTFAAPSRWFMETGERPVDVSFSGNPDSCLAGQEVRWPMLSRAFQTQRHHRSAITTCGLGFDVYFDLLRKSKLALCPSGADLTDSLRTMEAVASGAIPVFVGYPPRVRDPWFPQDTCISCTVDTLAAHLDEALSHDQTPKRQALWEHAKKYHTTAARTQQLVDMMS